ncbi:MAG: response regulator [Chloroflexota bacterium]|nr:response regulator [Chloroflexota bacterium]
MARRIMVVDDEAGIRLTVRVVLEPSGFEIVLADSGRKCIEKLQQGFRGLIFMDIMMPEMTGWDTIKEISRAGLLEGNLISVLSAKQPLDGDAEGLGDIGLCYLSKPFEPMELVSHAINRYSCLDNQGRF